MKYENPSSRHSVPHGFVDAHKQFVLEEFSVIRQRLLTSQIMKWTLLQNAVITLLLISAQQKNAQNVCNQWKVLETCPGLLYVVRHLSTHSKLRLKVPFISLYICILRLRWSRGSVLAFSTQVCGFKPG